MLSQAPPVHMHFGRASTHAAALLGLGILNLCVLLALALHGADAPTWTGVALLFCLIFWMAVRQWWRTPGGTLAWDGSAWHWSWWAQDAVSQVRWTLALPGFSVLRLSADNGAVQWLVTVPACEREPQWIAMRRALVAQKERSRGAVPAQIRV